MYFIKSTGTIAQGELKQLNPNVQILKDTSDLWGNNYITENSQRFFNQIVQPDPCADQSPLKKETETSSKLLPKQDDEKENHGFNFNCLVM